MYLPPKRQCAAMVLLATMFNSAAAGCARERHNDSQPLERHEYVQLHMGVQARLIVYAPTEQAAAIAARAAYARIAAIEDIASDYRPASELMRLCAKAGQGPMEVSEELFTLLAHAHELSRRSNGAFDVTAGPYVALWRVGRKTKQLPAPRALKEAGRLVGWEKMRLDRDRQTVELTIPGMRLDLGGIAKGYAGDQANRILREHGIRSSLFEAGGDIVVSDAPPGKKGWTVEIVASEKAKNQTIEVAHCGVSTSGDTEQFVEIDGTRYSHVVDPRTGMGLTQRFAATVIAPDGITSDSLSTAACAAGPEQGKPLMKWYRGAIAHIRRVE